jgi:hypothetical protein
MNPDKYKKPIEIVNPGTNTKESFPEAKIIPIEVAPGMSPQILEKITAGSDAVVLIVYATGTSPESLNGVIKQRTEKGIPVFLVSKNPGDAHGILKITYGPQQESKEAGAIALEKVNVNNLYDVIMPAIQDEFAKGKRGAGLGEAIREKFSYKDDESKPVPSWQDPVKFAQEELLYRQTLKRTGVKEEEIEEIIKKWKGKE